MTPDRIMVVDGEDAIRFVLQNFVSGMGHEVHAASSAREALDLIDRTPFAVAITDLVLPDGSGMALLDRIKHTAPGTEVIITTRHAAGHTVFDAIRAGAFDFVHKPFELDEISATLARALERRALAQHNGALATELERNAREFAAASRRLSSLNEAGLRLCGFHLLPQLFEFVLDLVATELDVERTSVMLLDDLGDMRIAAARGIDAGVAEATRVRRGEGIAGRVLKTGQPILLEDGDDSTGLTLVAVPGTTTSFVSIPIVMSVPIKSPDAVLGTFNLAARRSGVPFGPSDVDYLAGLAGQMGLAIERSRYLEQLQTSLGSLQAVQEQLIDAERLRVLSERVVNIAHDVGNTFFGVMDRVRLLGNAIENRTAELDDVRRSLEMIEKLSLQGAATVRRIQDAEGEGPDAPPEALDLNDVVCMAVKMTEPKWKTDDGTGRAKIEVALDLGYIEAVTTEGRDLAQAVSNLILNAVDALPEGGRVSLRTYRHNRHVCLEVMDDGNGMAAEVRDRVFEPFFSTRPAHQGLGLSVTHDIVARAGGTIAVDSEPGHGARFLIELPPTAFVATKDLMPMKAAA